MEKSKDKSGLIALMAIIIVILLTVVVLFATGNINLGKDKGEENTEV